MNATEMMIGDIVSVSGKPIHVTLATIKAGIEVKPIPLTPEILEKNGIKLSSTYTHPYRDGEWEEGELEEAMKHYPMYVYQTLNPHITFVIRPNEQELKVRSSNYKTIVEKKEEVIFVHELQHALKLCGIEKKVVL